MRERRQRFHSLVMISPSHTHTHVREIGNLLHIFPLCVDGQKEAERRAGGRGGGGERKRSKERAARQIERGAKLLGAANATHGVHQADKPP